MADITLSAPPNAASSSSSTFRISPGRRTRNRLWWGLCSLGLVFVVIPVVWVIIYIASKALGNWHWSILTTTTTGVGGGLSQAIVGTFMIMVGVGIFAGFVGIGCGIYLGEIAHPSAITTILRSGAEVLSGMPSIVFGYVAFLELVVALHWGYGLMPALIAVGMLVVPYVAKSTELALGTVPVAYREGGEALGMTKTHVLRRVVLRSAIPGMATGIIVALAISAGETAPLLFTAEWSTQYPTGALLHAPVGYLTYAAYNFLDNPFPAVQNLGYDAGFLLLVLVLVLILTSRLIVRLTQKYSPNRALDGAAAPRRRGRHSAASSDPTVALGAARER
jgi:phosphate transport system permease protein